MLSSVLAIGALGLLYWVLYLYRRRGDGLQDMITGLPSRDFFERYLQQCAARTTRHPQYGFAVLLLDIRGFTGMRRALGRFAAEEILADFAERATWSIRPSDVITRLNDDDFAIVLEDVRRVTDATRVAMRVQQSMTEAVTLAARAVPVRVTVGVTISGPGNLHDARVLIQEAENALARATESKRPYVVFDPELDAQSLADLSLESELMSALDSGELRLAYSPMVRSDSHDLAGFTALMQWQHPELGLLTARSFIHLAETSREILRMGQWAITDACAALIRFAATSDRPLIVTVNVGETELARGDVPSIVQAALGDRLDLAPRLRLEIPAAVLSNLGTTIETTVGRLHSLGVGIHLDHITATSIPLARTMRLGAQGARLSLAAYEAADPDTPAAFHRLLSACRTFAQEIVVEAVDSREAFALVSALEPAVLVQGAFVAARTTLDQAIELARTTTPATMSS